MSRQLKEGEAQKEKFIKCIRETMGESKTI